MAGRLQLNSIGKQDKFFTDDPEFSYFSQVHKKHTHFSKHNVKLEGNKPVDFGEIIKFTISQNQGDLLSKITFEFELDPVTLYNCAYIDSLGHALIEYVDLFVGGTLIERITTDYLQIFSEQSINESKQYGLYKTIGKNIVENITDDYLSKYSFLDFNVPKKFIVNIPFHFYNKPSLAMPICALKKQEIHLELKIRSLRELIMTKTNTKNYYKEFIYPTVPYQRAQDLNTSEQILDLQYIPELDTDELESSRFGGVGFVVSNLKLTRIKPYIYALKKDNLENYTIFTRDMYFNENKNFFEREACSFWRFQTNFLYKQSDPATPLDKTITNGNFIGTGQQFFAPGSSSATVPKFNAFYIGDELTGDIRYYENKEELSLINLGVGYGRSIAVSDDGRIVVVGAQDDTIKIVDYTDTLNPFEITTLNCGDATAQLRYTKISGDGTIAACVDIINARLYVFDLVKQRVKDVINSLENDFSFGLTMDGLRIVIGLQTASEARVYDYNSVNYILNHTIPVYGIHGTKVFVAISRNGDDMFYNQDYVIKVLSLREFKKVEMRDFRLNTEFILLDQYEKNIVSNSCRDIVFTQIQQAENERVQPGRYDVTIRTNFVNSIKELYFVFQCLRWNNEMLLPTCNYDNIDVDVDYQSNVCFYEHMYDIQMILNNEEVINKDSGKTFFLKSIQSGLHHTRTPMSRRFYSYSFATEPEREYPTGQRNFSVINNQLFKINLVPQDMYRREIRIYALTYNVLRLAQGEMQMIFPYRNMPVPTTANNKFAITDVPPFAFQNREGYVRPCGCPSPGPCPHPDEVPGDGYPMH